MDVHTALPHRRKRARWDGEKESKMQYTTADIWIEVERAIAKAHLKNIGSSPRLEMECGINWSARLIVDSYDDETETTVAAGSGKTVEIAVNRLLNELA
jgi:hypothetical protein